MEQSFIGYNTLLDAVSAPGKAWLQMATRYNDEKQGQLKLAPQEVELFYTLPSWHTELLIAENMPYAIKASLERMVNGDSDALNFWTDATSFIDDTPTSISIVQLSMLVYPYIEFVLYRRGLCAFIVHAIDSGNLKPYFYPHKLHINERSERERLQEYYHLTFEEKVMAKIELHELEKALTNNHKYLIQAYSVWKNYYDSARALQANEMKHFLEQDAAYENDRKEALRREVRESTKTQRYLILDEMSEHGIDPQAVARGQKAAYRRAFCARYKISEAVFDDRWKELCKEEAVYSLHQPRKKST